MKNLTILDTNIRVLDGLFSLNDLHKASGGANKHRPKYWLANEQTKDLIDEIVKGGIPPLRVQHGGLNPGTWVCKELVYYYAMWISPKFNLKVIRTFDELHNQQNSYIEMMNQLSAAFEHEKKKASKAGQSLNDWKSIKHSIEQKMEAIKAEAQFLLFD
ncbi:TPA: KilA-N domain-containing protein [Vibrio parahaemolyticus]